MDDILSLVKYNSMERNMAANPQNTAQRSKKSAASRQSEKKGPGRGWHGDSAGHAAAGAQSHKNKSKSNG